MIRQHAVRWNIEQSSAQSAADAADEDDELGLPGALLSNGDNTEPALEPNAAGAVGAEPRRPRRPLPTLRQAADWACALLDAQLVPFALHADAHPHVRSLVALVGRHVRLCKSVQRLSGHLTQVLKSAALPNTAAPLPEYCVEVAKW
jgi:hypothetical protein